jgi:hypothetical protein
MFGLLLLIAGGFLFIRGIDVAGFSLLVIGLYIGIFGFLVPEDKTKVALKAFGASTLAIAVMMFLGYIYVFFKNLTNPPNVKTMFSPALFPFTVTFILLTCIFYPVFYLRQRRRLVK